MTIPESTPLLLLSAPLLIFLLLILARLSYPTWGLGRRLAHCGLLTMSCLAILACAVWLSPPFPPSAESGPTPSLPISSAVEPVRCFTARSSNEQLYWRELPISTSSIPKVLRCSRTTCRWTSDLTSAWLSSTRRACTRIAPLHATRLRASCWQR